jgi:pimeloyl-ACP methyl ester carboxylesterase
MTAQIENFTLNIAQERLDDLKDRLARTRWPEKETVSDWSQGAPLAQVRALCEHWQQHYDWRNCEARLNAAGQFTTVIDGLRIHFLHVRSPNPDALPLLLTHGWPGSVIEFMKVLGPLSDPAAHGGDPADAFHLVVPSLPGYGFSEKPAEAGWGVERIARAWTALMERLGYHRFVAQGGDWGAAVTTAMAEQAPPSCAAIHLNMPIVFPTKEDLKNLTPEEAAGLEAVRPYRETGMGYANQQATKPQTLGYGLNDSPAGQAAWIYEKFHGWTDNQGTPESVLSRDELLDNIMLYWLPGCATSSARLYWESTRFYQNPPRPRIDIPVGVSMFRKELIRASRRWAENNYSTIIYWNELDKGGHFAAFEQPELFTQELRQCFRSLRTA